MIAFVIPNRGWNEDVSHFAVSVDMVESMTGLDFFKMLPDDKENELEAIADFQSWKKGTER
jgi:endonuclease G